MSRSPFASPELWPTAITTFDHDDIVIRGKKVEDLMGHGNFGDIAFLLLSGRMPSPAESMVWNAVMIASCDHGPTSPSTFAARVVASGNRRAPEAGVAAGILAIGDAHGGAGEEAMTYIREALTVKAIEGLSSAAAAEKIVDRYRQAGLRLPGMGHRFHAVDPRTKRLWDLAQQWGVASGGVAMMAKIQMALSASVGREMPVNVDGAIAAALVDLGFDPPIGRMAFILGRAAGIASHVLEELAREKPMRFRFDFSYDGPQQ
ncbi:citryl-CoA lyase [Mesorhizobium sp. CGMCC 1.15528]|uniref:citrate synthase (unknown stereospecificity) n=1 Tax=Mesorhizobium zhangyense TaxID=1776730 RepID=A0A7C9VAN5_9HYPH|nr:citryl-CoA lyase [Mesorhizobium zhangyense]NGN45165.1 citryl-CoA lyase [Mesorhizobium zhangyense]